ncbi:MAG: LysE family translocator [Prolixibacteraceae bacterium]
MTFEYFLAYFIILFIATITPGPNSLLAINHGINHGFIRTIYSGLGNLIGNLLMALISILGLGAVLIASGLIFNIVKWIGIIYLVFIGLKLIFEPIKTESSNNGSNKTRSYKSKSRLFIDGFVIAIGNPKGILFFTALFPQFINVKYGTVSGFMIIFITLGIVAFGCYMLYAICGAKLNGLFELQSSRKLFNRIVGSIFIGTGLAIAFSKK